MEKHSSSLCSKKHRNGGKIILPSCSHFSLNFPFYFLYSPEAYKCFPAGVMSKLIATSRKKFVRATLCLPSFFLLPWSFGSLFYVLRLISSRQELSIGTNIDCQKPLTILECNATMPQMSFRASSFFKYGPTLASFWIIIAKLYTNSITTITIS